MVQKFKKDLVDQFFDQSHLDGEFFESKSPSFKNQYIIQPIFSFQSVRINLNLLLKYAIRPNEAMKDLIHSASNLEELYSLKKKPFFDKLVL